MKETIAIFVGDLYFPRDLVHQWDETNLINGGIGGSEVWAIEIASRIEQLGYHCMLFADCETWHFADNGVEYIPYVNFKSCAKYNHFKAIISSRRVDELFDAQVSADVKILMFHDPFLVFNYNDDLVKSFDYYLYQSDYQLKMILENYPYLQNSKFFKTFQAIPLDSYFNIPAKKNQMVWSSHKIRGSKFLIEKILPLIRKEIPDFTINVCGYANDMTDDYFYTEGVNVLGNVEKKKLIELQLESKIWIYPYTGMFENGRINDETFCITAIENAAACNALVIPDKGCFSTSMEGYEHFLNADYYTGNILGSENFDRYAKDIANKAISYLKDDNARLDAANNAKTIVEKYTWENATKSIIDITQLKPEKKKHELLLVTGLIRTGNIHTIFDSIKNELFPIESINTTWLICHDVNKSNNIDQFIEELKGLGKIENFNWVYCPISLDKEKKFYGGDLFNEPLKLVKDMLFKDSDPWVYILDDDNTICPLLSDYIPDIFDAADEQSKKFILTHMHYDGGCLGMYNKDYYDFLAISYKRKNYYFPWHETFDPSQMFIRYSCLNSLGLFQGGLTYDLSLFHKLLDGSQDDVLTMDMLTDSESWRMNSWQTTHNAIPSENSINSIRSIINSNSKKDFVLCACSKKFGSNTVHIPEEAVVDIMNKYFNE